MSNKKITLGAIAPNQSDLFRIMKDQSPTLVVRTDEAYEHSLYGTGLFGESLAPKRQGNMAERFLVPPFSVLSARDGWWQDRKRAWIALGIKSELGRGGAGIQTNAVDVNTPGGLANVLANRSSGLLHLGGAPDRQRQYKANANPGGSLMPAMDYRNRERGNSIEKSIKGTAAAQTPEQQERAHVPGPSSNGQDTGIATELQPANPEMGVRVPLASVTPVTFAPKSTLLVPTSVPQRANGATASLAAPLPSPAQKHVVMAGVRAPRAVAPRQVTVPAPRPVEPLEDPFLAHHARALRAAGKGRMFFDVAEWDHAANTAVGLDVEVYSNFFLACFKRFSDGRRLAFEKSPRADLDANGLRNALESNVTVSFNGLNYDLHVLREALDGADCARLHELSQAIVSRGDRPSRVKTGWKHVDLFEVNPSIRMGLKLLHGRLHGRWLVDLPYPPDSVLTPEQMNHVTLYCMNDLDALEALREALRGPLEMRAALGKQHGLDLRSKSDAQVGEAILRALLGRVDQPKEPASFGYVPPGFLKFSDENLQKVLRDLSEATFSVGQKGVVIPPKWLEDLQVTLGATTYSMGIGGLHSTEAHRALRSDDEHFLLDVDASSQYPLIIIAMGLHPPAAGAEFTRVYSEIVNERLAAKAAGDRIRSDGLKIAVNGAFGKFGSPYSFLYAPHMLLATTLTGQLSLLMLAEAAENVGVGVVSANTDGVVFRCPRDRSWALDEVLEEWEVAVGMQLERTRYRALYSSSVNTYIAVKEDGGVKRKGWIANPWVEGDLRGMMSKNPQMTVLSDAAVAHLVDGVPLEETVGACQDPRAFVTVIRVNGGGSWRGTRLGRVARYYWSTDGEPIVYTDSGRRVAKTEGARPLMELADRVPADLDRARYVREAEALLTDLGIGGGLHVR